MLQDHLRPGSSAYTSSICAELVSAAAPAPAWCTLVSTKAWDGPRGLVI
jgi:hypothetical protein